MKYEAIIFDMDGTITNSEGLWVKATDQFFEVLDIRLSCQEREAFYNEFAGVSIQQVTVALKQKYALDKSLDDLMDEYIQLALGYFDEEVRFVDGFLDFHAKLDERGLKYAIATNADLLTLNKTKSALSLDALFGRHIYSIDDVNKRAKPDPDVYLHAASQIKVEPRACIAIEDTACGLRAAKAANMFCIGINTHNDPHQLQEADLVIDGYQDIDLETLLKHL